MKVQLLVLAKAPVAGRVKTRLCPPCTPAEAAALAEAALRDTLAAVASVADVNPVVVLDGAPGPWLPPTFVVVQQRQGSLADRLAGAFADTCAPALLVGMDTPQVTPALLAENVTALLEPGIDAVIGPALDGGYWAIGLRGRRTSVFDAVPMSAPDTLAAQRHRFVQLGMRVTDLPMLRDVDDLADAAAVAALAPASRFAAAYRELSFVDAATLT